MTDWAILAMFVRKLHLGHVSEPRKMGHIKTTLLNKNNNHESPKQKRS